jgi:tetratricopeptide (TPR) repeat protein
MELFNAGVLLYHVESYHDAAAAFMEFSKTYAAREVFNNIGACYFQLAMKRILKDFSDDYFRFWLSVSIDYTTTAVKFRSRGDGNYLSDKDIAGYINKAVEYFQQAAKKDPLHRATLCNLSAALLLNMEYAKVLAACDKVLNKYPQDIYALNNKAIALYYYGKQEDMDMTQKAIHELTKAHRLERDNLEVEGHP